MTARYAAVGAVLGLLLFLAGLYLLLSVLASVAVGVAAVLLASGVALAGVCLITDDGKPRGG